MLKQKINRTLIVRLTAGASACTVSLYINTPQLFNITLSCLHNKLTPESAELCKSCNLKKHCVKVHCTLYIYIKSALFRNFFSLRHVRVCVHRSKHHKKCHNQYSQSGLTNIVSFQLVCVKWNQYSLPFLIYFSHKLKVEHCISYTAKVRCIG